MNSNTALVYYCHDCQTPFVQPFGRQSSKTSEKTGVTNFNYHAGSGPPVGLESRCTECQGKYSVRISFLPPSLAFVESTRESSAD